MIPFLMVFLWHQTTSPFPTRFPQNLLCNSPEEGVALELDLICDVLDVSEDEDNDVIYYTFDWIDPDGNLISGTPSTDHKVFYQQMKLISLEHGRVKFIQIDEDMQDSVEDMVEVIDGCPLGGDGLEEIVLIGL